MRKTLAGLVILLAGTAALASAVEEARKDLLEERIGPAVAILREQGINGQVEMAAAFHLAGFESVDVYMTDLFAARDSPFSRLPFLSAPSQRKTSAFSAFAAATAMIFNPWLPG